MSRFDASTVTWHKFDQTTHAGQAWECAERWLSDFGISLGVYSPDGAATLEGDYFAFRIDGEKGRAVIVFVQMDYDADVSGDRYVDRSTATNVEVVRA